MSHVHPITIYYEDTDLSGFVYHPNYLKYFERAREHVFGVQRLAEVTRESGVGWVVYRCEMTFKAPARHGDQLEVQSQVRIESDYRVTFDHRIVHAGQSNPLVLGRVEMVCVDRKGTLVPVPDAFMTPLRAEGNVTSVS